MRASQQFNIPEPGFGIYFHWPFCRKKCPYCDFNSHVREAVDQTRWSRALLTELEYFARTQPKIPVTSIFFGGGTPSLMSPDTVAQLIDGVRSHFSFSNDIEITLEANPTSVEATSFDGYRQAGVTRLSMGIQSLRDDALRFLGREHSVSEALAAIETARNIFDNISFDLIYALPDQSTSEWQQDLTRALNLAGDHLSLYQLTIEPNTGFAGAVRRGEFMIPGDAKSEALFEITQSMCEDAGRPAYEISNHARPGFECRHNLTYWRYGDYLGIGPGAHGRFSLTGVRTASRQLKRPENWLKEVEEKGHGSDALEALPDPRDRAEELMLMGLRLTEGVWFKNFVRSVGSPLMDFIDQGQLKILIENGLIETDEKRIRATKNGRLVLNSLLPELLAD